MQPDPTLPLAVLLLCASIAVAVGGGRIAASRALVTRFLSVRGGAARALGLALLVLGLAGVGVAWTIGLRLRG